MFSTSKNPLTLLSLNRAFHNSLWGENPASVAPYVPSPHDVVRKMLELAEVGPDDIVYDLGCGDGRILFTAILEFKAKKAIGFDLNEGLCRNIKKKAEELQLQDKIQAVNSNFLSADLSPATVITLYLTTSGNEKLKPKLEKESRAGTRVISHDFPVKGWSPTNSTEGESFIYHAHSLYLYKIPEAYIPKQATKDSTPSKLQRIRSFFQP